MMIVQHHYHHRWSGSLIPGNGINKRDTRYREVERRNRTIRITMNSTTSTAATGDNARNDVILRRASTSDDFDSFKQLCREFNEWLQLRHNFDLSWQDFEKEMNNLPYPYGEPEGFIFLAMLGDQIAGCVALKPLPLAINVQQGIRVCEMKRLFVKETSRGLGIGKQLVETCLASARELPYDLMVLDTIPRLTSANKIYQQVGFTPRDSYYSNTEEEVIYYELALKP